jgi:phage/plasmid primase-like uncharacterized protein
MTEEPRERTYLAVPFGENNEAKALGARWDIAVKSWYVPPGGNPALFERWRPERQRSAYPDPIAEFAQALLGAGLILKGAPIMDGRLHRVPVEGDRGGRKSGAYAGHLDAVPGGYIENFKTGEKRNWKSAMPAYTLGAGEQARRLQQAVAKRAERESERQAIHAETIRLLEAHLAAAVPAPTDHPYLLAKGVGSHGVLIDRVGPLEIAAGREHTQKWSAKGNLLIPLRDIDGQLVGAQSIDAEGRKFFPRGARLVGGMHRIGTSGGETIVIVEGYATGAAVHQATGLAVVVAFNAANLETVALAMRGAYPEAHIIIAGDNDHHNPRGLSADGRPKSNVGRVAAEKAAAAVDGFALVPIFAADDASTDWNDLARAHGAAAFAQQWQTGMAVAERRLEAKAIAAARQNERQTQPIEATIEVHQKPRVGGLKR